MCGIVGSVGSKQVQPFLLEGLRRLEYRGYDSAGIAVVTGAGLLKVVKCAGKLDTLVTALARKPMSGIVGIGHTRWATQGEANDINAHPHCSTDEHLALVHNGVITNAKTLRAQLEREGYTFRSATDTEVLVHLIDSVRRSTELPLVEAVCQALTQVEGTYGLALVSADDPGLLVGARNGSPLIIGIGDDGYFLASDPAAFLERTRTAVPLEDGEVVAIDHHGFAITNLEGVPRTRKMEVLEQELAQIEKGSYPHFMLKEIMEQPESVTNCLRGRIDHGLLKLGGLTDVLDRLQSAPQITLVACGTSWHAALVGEYVIEQLARIPVEVEYASQYRYRNPIINEGDVVLAISQSGETADTLAAVRLAQDGGALVLGVVNVVGSQIAKATVAGVYLHAGPEIGVASTKAFTAQVTVLSLIALKLAEGRTLTEDQIASKLQELQTIPDKMRQVLALDDEIKRIAEVFYRQKNCLYLGQGYSFPVALEGALKLKEISYIHAEGYPAAEIKHGSIALVEESLPVVFVALQDNTYSQVVANMEQVKTRGGMVIAITEEDNNDLDEMCEAVIRIPHTDECLSPLLTTLPLQLLAYHVAVLKGCDVDQPRNLAKSVTVS